MTFKKLALASAIALVPMTSFAVEVLEDEALSAATGQDGIQIGLDLSVVTNTIIHDTDGLPGGLSGVTTADAAAVASYVYDGAIVIEGLAISATNNGSAAADGVLVNVDAGDNDTAGVAPTLNVNVVLQGNVTISTGSISVANSNRDQSTWGYTAQSGTIISNADIVLGGATLNIQLGAEPQGAMILLDTSITNGVTINGGSLSDLNSGGSAGAGVVHVEDSGAGTNLTVRAAIDIDATGLQVRLLQVGDATAGMDVQVERVYVGTQPAAAPNTVGYIGDIEMTGLNLNGTVVGITGK